MFFRILKNDLKRKKTMNIILFLFIVLAAMFVAGGINNVVTVMNGTDYYLDKAGVGDFVIVTSGEHAVGALDHMLKTEEAIQDYRLEQVVFGSQDDITGEDGKEKESKNVLVYQSIENSAITFFDMDNEPVTRIEPGHIYATGSFMEINKLKPGDVICLEHSGAELKFILDGTVKDALLGSDFMGNTRFIMSEEDMNKLLENQNIYESYRGEICYIDTKDVAAVASAAAKSPNVIFSGTRSTIKTAYMMEMIIAFIMLVLSVCLIVVSLVVLKFSITFTITKEFRQIGVMKAIGLSNGRVRSLYIVKYFMMALAGAVLGFFGSIPFSRMLLDSVSKKMMLGNDGGILVNAFGSFLVVCVIVLFAYICTGKVKRFTPVDAIRSGQTGERYKNKTILRIEKFPGGNALFMALNDVLSSPGRFLSVIISFGFCTLFVLMLVNTTATLNSPNLLDTLVTESHLYAILDQGLLGIMEGTREDMEERLDEMGEELTKKGMPARVCIELLYKYPVTFDGRDYVLNCQQGLHTDHDQYVYLEGTAPQNKYEIAITPQISEMTGAWIGDTVTIHYDGEDMDCMVTAYYQSMNNMGNTIRLYEDAPADISHLAAAMDYQIDFTDDPSEEEVELRKERVRELFDFQEVMNATEYCIECMGVADTLESVQFLFLAITVVVVILVTVLMEKSFIADEKSQVAILKAMGFQDAAVVRWHVYRLGLAALAATVLAAAVSIPMTKLCITPIFGIMGALDVDYRIDPLQIFLLYPCIILGTTVIVTWITALNTKSIAAADTANIE